MRQKYAIVVIVSGTLLCFACAAHQANSPGSVSDGILITPDLLSKITGIQWELTKMILDNKSIDLVKNSKTTFSCDRNGRVSGLATINRYSGAFKLQPDGEVIWNKAFIMTRMAGPPELMQQEASFTQALMNTSRMFLNEPKLTLRSDDGSTVLEFEPAE